MRISANLVLPIAVPVLLVLQACTAPGLPAMQSAARRDPAGTLQRGQVLASAAGCRSCHSAPDRTPFSGGRKFGTPIGDVISPNITSDREGGIGSWSSRAFYTAVARGTKPDGSVLTAAMPFEHFSAMDPADIEAIRLFLLTTAPEPSKPDAGGGQTGFGRPLISRMWRGMFGRWVRLPDRMSVAPQIYRGAYLAEAVVHCGACHTPRGSFGQRKPAWALAGSDAAGEWAPDIRNLPETALYHWTDEQLFVALRTGEAPHRPLEGSMREVVENMSALDDDDLRAIIAWLRSRKDMQ